MQAKNYISIKPLILQLECLQFELVNHNSVYATFISNNNKIKVECFFGTPIKTPTPISKIIISEQHASKCKELTCVNIIADNIYIHELTALEIAVETIRERYRIEILDRLLFERQKTIDAILSLQPPIVY